MESKMLFGESNNDTSNTCVRCKFQFSLENIKGCQNQLYCVLSYSKVALVNPEDYHKNYSFTNK